jgi:DNA polymerase alpha subunit B
MWSGGLWPAVSSIAVWCLACLSSPCYAFPRSLVYNVTQVCLQVLSPLQEFREENPGLRVLLQPAVTDAHHLPVHPQPPFASARGLEMLPSPAHLSIDGCRVSCSGSRVIMDLASCEVGHSAIPADRVAALNAHLLKQQSMYPVFPPAQGACVDFAHRSHLQLNAQPDVLLLPSLLAPNASVVPFDQGATLTPMNVVRAGGATSVAN